MSIKLNSTLCIFVQNTWGRKRFGRSHFPNITQKTFIHQVPFLIGPLSTFSKSIILNVLKATSRNEATSLFYLTWKLISTCTHLRLQSSKPRRGEEEEANKFFSYRSKFSHRAFTQFPLPLLTHFHGEGLLISEHCLDCSPRRWIVHLGGGSVSQDILIFPCTNQSPVS